MCNIFCHYRLFSAFYITRNSEMTSIFFRVIKRFIGRYYSLWANQTRVEYYIESDKTHGTNLHL